VFDFYDLAENDMHFIQEAGFTVELDGIAKGCVDDLTRDVEKACRCASRNACCPYGFVQLEWDGAVCLIWYCVNGDTVTLVSITSACP
jgi:hypothetical protein